MQLSKFNKLLKKIELLILTVLIIFLLACKNVSAANFAYKDFDFAEFKKQNEGYWLSGCKKIEDEGKKEECEDVIISAQEDFYTRLYDLLAQKQSKELFIDDAAIIATAFFEYDPGVFTAAYGAYDVPENDVTDEIDYSQAGAEYLESEKDNLKTLVNAMIGKKRICYGVNTPIKSEDETNICIDGGKLETIDGTEKCLYNFDGNVTSVSTWTKFRDSGVGTFFGLSTGDADNCSNLAKENGYEDGYPDTESGDSVVIEGYWNFLEESNYLDKKEVLKRYYTSVLSKTNTTSMEEFYKLPQSTQKDYKDDLLKIRKTIVKGIRNLYESYRNTRPIGDYNSTTEKCESEYIWPVGSKETTESGGIAFAIGEPASVIITSNFSNARLDPVGGVEVRAHTGVDIGGSSAAGVNNIIAAKSGTVAAVHSGCTSFGDYSCGGGYGNHILIMHTDGTYTLYAHLHQDTITVSEGDSVQQGQVIGKMGSSGHSTGTHLHFEVRLDRAQSSAVDPLDGYIDPDNPRPSAVCGSSGMDEKFMEWIVAFEGTDEYLKSIGDLVGDQYIVDCRVDIPTVGPGVTLWGCKPYFEKYGYNLTTSNNYFNYCGASFPKDVIIKIKNDVIADKDKNIREALAKRGITLQQYQINALISLSYNGWGGIDAFVNAYKTYGSGEALCTNWWNSHYVAGDYESVLRKRRQKECKLFTTGEYEMWG